MSLPPARFTLHLAGAGNRDTFAADVRAGLTATPKHLACRYFYDEEGAQLFDAICELPEYYLTRTERAILQAHAPAIVASVPAPVALVELGSGSAAKTRLLIEALLQRQPALRYVPLDINRAVLEESASHLLRDYPRLAITALAAEYHEGLSLLPTVVAGPESRLILWLGSNIGNFDRPDAASFLGGVAGHMASRDRLLAGIDLRKERTVLERAYDDAAGVTARFNKNLLVRINRELAGNFDLAAFRHRAVYDEVTGRVAMYLVSTRPQRVRIAALDLDVLFAEGEPVHTENSWKYSLDEIAQLADAAGLHLAGQWLDPERRFSVTLLART